MERLTENTAHVESRHAAGYNGTRDTNGFDTFTANAASTDNCDADNVDGGDVVTELRTLLGHDVVLLPIPTKAKGPINKGWQQTTVDRMDDAAYLARLVAGNVGVLLGAASGGLCAIDIDGDEFVEPFLDLNPRLKITLRSKGSRGVQLWVRVNGEYPKLTKIKTNDGADWGEWRCDGGQSVIHGIHPDGRSYRRLVDASPAVIRFDEIVWPESLKLPWAKDDYDGLVEEDGLPFTVSEAGSVMLNQMFFVRKYMLEHYLLYDAGLGEFFEYNQANGMWKRQTVDSIKRSFAADLTRTAKETGHHNIYAKRTDSLLNGLVQLLRCQAEKQDVFSGRKPSIHVANGMICFEGDDVVLRSFHPDFLSRNQCPYAFDPEADCPRFKQDLLGSALGADDIELLQKWAGCVLLGRNAAQRFLLLLGTPNGGKSTLMSILEQTIGLENVSQVRTDHLHDRFELFGFVGKTLLTGKDVAANFLMSKGAYVLKALVGHDLLEAEKKGFNERVQIRGDFNVGITCNADLNIRLEGDVGAWRRRLLVIKYDRPAPPKPIPDFADQLLEQEGPGILRWMVEGAIGFLNDLRAHGNYVLSPGQKRRIDVLMDQSDSVRRFVEQGVEYHKGGDITATDLLTGYYEYCEEHGWHPMSTSEINAQLPKHMLEVHKANKRHDIDRGGKMVRGYKHVRLAVIRAGGDHEN